MEKGVLSKVPGQKSIYCLRLLEEVLAYYQIAQRNAQYVVVEFHPIDPLQTASSRSDYVYYLREENMFYEKTICPVRLKDQSAEETLLKYVRKTVNYKREEKIEIEMR